MKLFQWYSKGSDEMIMPFKKWSINKVYECWEYKYGSWWRELYSEQALENAQNRPSGLESENLIWEIFKNG